ncbi:hypothetical protein [Ostreiculturibacter nitratireducens]|uniref:hypothetical protein n=1 Tax=Ostreiculturibacter nitratireducens TaxID=3075226 RepID=UPI0031B5C315
MSLQTLDRTQWSYAEALAHVQTVTVARRATEAAKAPPKPVPAHNHWNPPQDPTIAWKAEAANELLVALRDGDLIAQGRYTEERPNGWGYGNSSGFGLHSGYHTSIRPEQWREGKYLSDRLTARDWEFIDIRMPRFLVKAIWLDYIPEPVRPAQDAEDAIYTTPYLDLMQAAIAHFEISPGNQCKKECLMDWFLEQQIDGEPVSNKLADAMATLIRLPSAQRGGAKRVVGPDLRQTA